MSKFITEQSFWELFPESEIGIVLAKGFDNTGAAGSLSQIQQFLEQGNKDAGKHFTEEVFSENPVIAVWRQAYRKFKTKKGVRCSIEALLKRVQKGNEVGSINPLVDLYNGISLKYGLPCGGEDIDTFQGDLRLAVSQGDDVFRALGDEENDNTLPGELCYVDDVGAVCRCWNWRDGQRTMLTEKTVNAFLIIESVDPSRSEDLKIALEELAQKTTAYLGGTTEIHILGNSNREVEL